MQGIRDLFLSNRSLPLVLSVDSRGLYLTVTTLHEGRDYRPRPTVCRLLDSFETGEISVIQWVSGSLNISDALTKRNVSMYMTLNKVCTSGLLRCHLLATKRELLQGILRSHLLFVRLFSRVESSDFYQRKQVLA